MIDFKKLISDQKEIKSNAKSVNEFIIHCEQKLEQKIKENPFCSYWEIEISDFSKWFPDSQPSNINLKAFVKNIKSSEILSKGVDVEFKMPRSSVSCIDFPSTIRFSLHENNIG